MSMARPTILWAWVVGQGLRHQRSSRQMRSGLHGSPASANGDRRQCGDRQYPIGHTVKQHRTVEVEQCWADHDTTGHHTAGLSL